MVRQEYSDRRTFAHSLCCVDLGAILHRMECKVNFRDWLLLLDCADGIVDLLGATLVDRAGLSLGVHGRCGKGVGVGGQVGRVV